MFAIYCIAVFSLNQLECEALFGTPRQDVLRRLQLGTREALLNCELLDCLTAFHLYLYTIKPDTDPRALSSLLGNSLVNAQRMGIHNEATNCRHGILEAEMRRRLWWSMVLFDARIAEVTDLKTSNLIPTWGCKVPLDVNDFDLRAEMKRLPLVYTQTSEALFAVVRSKIGDGVRNEHSHLDFVNPALKPIARNSCSDALSGAHDLQTLESTIETQYLSKCDLDNPIHYMTIWMARVSLTKAHFTHHLAAFGLVLQAWTAREKALGRPEEPPLIVTQILKRVDNMHANGHTMGQPRDFVQDDEGSEMFTAEPMEFGTFNSL
ncbi:hypothetical protein NX059_010010 [Plenodomus lindquistii]|nr:hypothetical protein NX059_010010 [Plenodomus lindquistii]